MNTNELLLKELFEAGGSGWISSEGQAAYNELVGEGLVESDGVADEEGDVFYRLSDVGHKWLEASAEPKKPAKEAKAKANGKADRSPIDTPISMVTSMRVDPDVAVSAVSTEIDTEDTNWNRPYRVRTRRINPTLMAMREAIDFDSLPVGGSKHIAATDAVPEPWLTYARLVIFENRRYATPKLDENGAPITVTRRSRKDPAKTRPVGVFEYARKFVIYQAKPDDIRGPGARIKRLTPIEMGLV